MLINHLCKCCNTEHKQLPTNARVWQDEELKLVNKPSLIGWFFECACGSTMFIKNEVLNGKKEKKIS